MKNSMIVIILAAVLVLFSGCQTGGCIKIDGTYGEYGGGIEYCFDGKQAKESGTPAFVEKGAGGEKTLFGFDMDIIEKIKDKLKDSLGMKALEAGPAEVTEQHPVKELLELLEEKEEDNAE